MVTVLIVVVGLINLLPVVGVSGSVQLAALYGQTVTDPDLLLLMQHRAALSSVLGALLIAAAFRPQLRGVATVAAVASMASFRVLALPIDAHSDSLRRIFWTDIVALPVLILAWWLSGSHQIRSR